MTQVTKAMGEIPRSLSQIYYSIDGHEKGGERVRRNAREGEGKIRREGREGSRLWRSVSKKRMKLGACGRRKGRL